MAISHKCRILGSVPERLEDYSEDSEYADDFDNSSEHLKVNQCAPQDVLPSTNAPQKFHSNVLAVKTTDHLRTPVSDTNPTVSDRNCLTHEYDAKHSVPGDKNQDQPVSGVDGTLYKTEPCNNARHDMYHRTSDSRNVRGSVLPSEPTYHHNQVHARRQQRFTMSP